MGGHHDNALVDSPPDNHLVVPDNEGDDNGEHLPSLVAGLRRSTRAAEGDVLFLQRRVQKLRAEEAHVWRRLETARQLREKVDATRARRQEEAEWRAAQRQRELDCQSRERARLHDERDAHRHSLFLARSKLAMDRRELSARVRSESQELAKQRIAQLSASTHHAEHHRQLIADMRQRTMTSRAQRSEHRQRNTEQSHEQEAEALRNRHEQHVKVAASLLTEEAQIIHRLQQIKRETTSVLSSVSSTPSPRKPPRPPTSDIPRTRGGEA
jgi:hypothetical protein